MTMKVLMALRSQTEHCQPESMAADDQRAMQDFKIHQSFLSSLR